MNTPGKKWSLEDDDEEEEDDIKQKVEAARAGIMEALGETGEEVEENPVEEEDEVDPLDSFMQVSDHFIQSFWSFPSIYISFFIIILKNRVLIMKYVKWRNWTRRKRKEPASSLWWV